MRKVEEIAGGRFAIYVDERSSKDTYYVRWWDQGEKKQLTKKLGGRYLEEVRGEALDFIRPLISADDIIESADPVFPQIWLLYQNRQKDRITPERWHLNELRWPLYYQPYLAGARSSRITAALVKMKDALLKIGRAPGDKRKPLSPNTVYDIVSTARAAVEYARSINAASVPPVPTIEVAGVIAPREGRTPKGRILALAEIGALIDAAATEKDGSPSQYPHVLHELLLHVGSAGRSGAIIDLTEPQILWELGVFDLQPYMSAEDRAKPRGIVPISGPLWWVLEEACRTIGRDKHVVHYRGERLRGKNATQTIFRIRERALLDGRPLNFDRLNNYSFRHTLANWLRDHVPEGYISAMLGHSVMVPLPDRWRMHELAATTTRQNYFDNHPENREIGRHKRMLDHLSKIGEAMDQFWWPEIQRHCSLDLRLGEANRSKTEATVALRLAK